MEFVKKIIFIFAFCPVILASSCGIDNNIEKTDTFINNQSTVLEGTMKDYSDVKSISISDIFDNMYKNDLYYNLSEEQVDEFKNSVDDLVKISGQSGSRPYYKINIYDSKNNVIDYFYVDINNCIIDSNGNLYNKKGKIKDWIANVENCFHISLDSVFGRCPSNEYFSLLQFATKANLNEIVRTNFDQKLKIEISPDDIDELFHLISKANFSEKPVDIDSYKYILEFFSSSGQSMYIIYIDKDINWYNEYGYQILSDDVKRWTMSLMDRG